MPPFYHSQEFANAIKLVMLLTICTIVVVGCETLWRFLSQPFVLTNAIVHMAEKETKRYCLNGGDPVVTYHRAADGATPTVDRTNNTPAAGADIITAITDTTPTGLSSNSPGSSELDDADGDATGSDGEHSAMDDDDSASLRDDLATAGSKDESVLDENITGYHKYSIDAEYPSPAGAASRRVPTGHFHIAMMVYDDLPDADSRHMKYYGRKACTQTHMPAAYGEGFDKPLWFHIPLLCLADKPVVRKSAILNRKRSNSAARELGLAKSVGMDVSAKASSSGTVHDETAETRSPVRIAVNATDTEQKKVRSVYHRSRRLKRKRSHSTVGDLPPAKSIARDVAFLSLAGSALRAPGSENAHLSHGRATVVLPDIPLAHYLPVASTSTPEQGALVSMAYLPTYSTLPIRPRLTESARFIPYTTQRHLQKKRA